MLPNIEAGLDTLTGSRDSKKKLRPGGIPLLRFLAGNSFGIPAKGSVHK